MRKNISRQLAPICFIVLAALSFGGVAQVEQETPESIQGAARVSAEELIELIEKSDNLVVIDARKKIDRDGGFVEGSISLTDTDTNEISLARVIPDKATPVVFYCNGIKCGRSVEAAKIAVANGYQQVYWFRGGWEEWLEKKLPITH